MIEAKDMSESEAEEIIKLAIGRILRLSSRPYQQGDDDQYTMARNAAFEAADRLRIKPAYHMKAWTR